MKYEDFVCAAKREVELKVGKDMRVELHTALKNNGKEKIGLAIKDKNINITPAIYLEEYYEIYQSGDTIGAIAESIMAMYQRVRFFDSLDTDDYLEYERIRKTLVCKLIHYENNKKLLESVPHIRYLDLAIVFYNLIQASSSGITSMLLKNEHIKTWGVDTKQLYRDALENAQKELPVRLESMNAVIGEFFHDSEREQIEAMPVRMYMISNAFRNFGAVCILYKGELKKIGELLEDNYYLIPSSIHEMLIIPEKLAPSVEELEEMIEGVNQVAVEDVDVLSNHPYYYNRLTESLLY